MMMEIDTPDKLYKYMKENIKYGFMSRNNTKFLREEVDENKYMNNIIRNYYYQSPTEVYRNKIGICFDQIEFARSILASNGYNVSTYYTKIHNHVFLVIHHNDKYYYFERSFPHNNGIFEFNSFEELCNYYLTIQKDSKLNEVEFYHYKNISYGCDFYDFIASVKKQNDIKLVLKRN